MTRFGRPPSPGASKGWSLPTPQWHRKGNPSDPCSQQGSFTRAAGWCGVASLPPQPVSLVLCPGTKWQPSAILKEPFCDAAIFNVLLKLTSMVFSMVLASGDVTSGFLETVLGSKTLFLGELSVVTICLSFFLRWLCLVKTDLEPQNPEEIFSEFPTTGFQTPMADQWTFHDTSVQCAVAH